MIAAKIDQLLKSREFISIATCDFNGRPNVAPKFFLKLTGRNLYLVDHILGTTYQNLKINPRVSISLMDIENLRGYQINGSVEIIEKGVAYSELLKEFQEKEISLSTKRIIDGLDRGKSHANFEISISEKIAVFKISIEEFVEIGTKGEIVREKA